MTNYYIEKDSQIVLFDTDREKIKNTLSFIPSFSDLELKETEREIVYKNDTLVFADEIQSELLQEAKEEKIKEINLAKEKAFKAGIIFKNACFDCDDRAQDRTGNRLLLLQAMPVETLEWLDYDYKPVEMTALEFQELCAAIFERVQFIEFRTGQFFEAVEEAQTIENLDSLVIDYQQTISDGGETNE